MNDTLKSRDKRGAVPMTGRRDLNARDQLRKERKLISAAVDGDREAFAALYREHAGVLFTRVLFPKLGQRQAAEDALSETFRAALERLHTFKPGKVSIYFWLARIASNKAMDMHRVRGRTNRALANFEGLMSPLIPTSDEPGARVEQEQELTALRTRIDEVLAGLNPRYRRAIELRLIEERSRQECADLMEVKLGTFDVVFLRAVKAFRRDWAR